MNTIKQQFCWFLLLAGLSAMSLSFGMSTARGELLFSDSFQYPAGPLTGQGPPAGAPPGQTGWTAISGTPQAVSMGLTFPNVFSVGGAALVNGNNNDQAIAGLTSVTSGVVWIGAIVFREPGSNNSGFAVFAPTGNGGIPPGIGVLDFQNVYGIDNDDGKSAASTISPGITPDWLVVKLDFDKGTETLYVNPMPGGSAPNVAPTLRLRMDPSFKAAGFSEIWLDVGSNDSDWIFDEVRIGTTFFDVRTNR